MLRCFGVAVLIAFAAPTAAGAATTYDAFTSFNGSNPAGSFQYFSGGVPLTAPAGDCVSGLSGLTCLQTAAGTDGPAFYKSQTNFTLSSDGGTNNLRIINTALAVEPDVAGAGVFFFAPAAGTYFINASFNAQDDLATGVTITGVQGLSGVLSFNPVGSANSIPANTSFTKTVTLGTGDLYGFTFGPGQSANHDLTAFNFTVSAVPEPATWMTMLLGFGAIGMALRRRMTTAAA
jgi:hypothetical protein